MYIFILWRRWLYVIGVQSERVCTYLSSVTGDPFCEVVRRPENTHDMFAWVTCRSLPSHETSGSLPFTWTTSGSLPSVQNYNYILSHSPKRKHEYPLCCMYFLFMVGYRHLHTSSFFFPPSNLFILPVNGNICHYP